MDFRKISDKIYENTEDRGRMEAMNDLYYEMANLIKEKMPDEYKEFTERAEDVLYAITSAEAEEIVRKMRPTGEHWTVEEVDSVLEENGIAPSTDYYLVMNMLYNDYSKTIKSFDVNTVDFYIEMAKDFIEDEDGVSHKVAKYFTMC